MEPESPALQSDSLPVSYQGSPVRVTIPEKIRFTAVVAASLLSHVQLCGPVACGPPGSVRGISPATILEWVAISFSIKIL